MNLGDKRPKLDIEMAEEGFNNAVPTVVEDMTDEKFLTWVQKQQNAVVTCGTGGGISKLARMLMGLAANKYLSSAKVLREFSLFDVVRLTRAKKRDATCSPRRD